MMIIFYFKLKRFFLNLYIYIYHLIHLIVASNFKVFSNLQVAVNIGSFFFYINYCINVFINYILNYQVFEIQLLFFYIIFNLNFVEYNKSTD